MANLSNINNKFLVTTGGNVGIGDTGPSTRLTVDVPAILNNTVNLFQLGDDTNGLVFKKFWNASGIAWRLNKGVSGVNMMTFSQDGKVGIGTDTPTEKLHIKSTTSGSFIRFEDNGGSGVYVGSRSDDLEFYAGNSEKMVILSGGNVGIGETSPGYKLDVVGSIKASVQGRFANGSASTPAYSFDSDSDSGIYRATTNALGFATTGTERMRIDSSGNVGIGKSQSGNAVLTVKSPAGGNTGIILIEGDTTDDGWGVYATTANKYIITRFTGGSYSDKFTILEGGNVGIGTDLPYAKLSVKDGTNINLGIKVGQTDTTAVMLNAYNDAVNANIPMEFRASKFAFQYGNVGIGTASPSTKLEISGNNTSRNTLLNLLTLNGGASASNPYDGFGVGIKFNGRDYSNAVRDYAYIYGVIEDQSSSSTPAGDPGFESQLRFYTNTGGASAALPTQKMVITAAGNVGIGSTSPSKKLEVAGSYKLGTNAWIQYDAAYPYTISMLNSAGVGNLILNAGYGSSGYESKIELQGSNTVGAAGITLSTGSSPRIVVTADGKVGIGTTSPDYELDVNGSIRAGRVTTNVQYYATTNSASNQYFHIKTSVNANSQICMHTWSIEGYAYGSGVIIDCKLAFHTDASNNIYGKSYLGSLANNIYRSGDNYVVLVFGTLNTYYTHFYVNLFEGMYTPLNSTVLAVSYSPNNSGVY